MRIYEKNLFILYCFYICNIIVLNKHLNMISIITKTVQINI